MAYLLAFVGLFAVVILSSFVCRSTAKCGGKTILTSLQGSIDTGPNNYPANTQCEWLIEGKHHRYSDSSHSKFTLLFIHQCVYLGM